MQCNVSTVCLRAKTHTIFPSEFLDIFSVPTTWYVSDDGMDDKQCGTLSYPCHHLQTVLDRAPHHVYICVLSSVLFLDDTYDGNECMVDSPVSFSLSSLDNATVALLCEKGNKDSPFSSVPGEAKDCSFQSQIVKHNICYFFHLVLLFFSR